MVPLERAPVVRVQQSRVDQKLVRHFRERRHHLPGLLTSLLFRDSVVNTGRNDVVTVLASLAGALAGEGPLEAQVIGHEVAKDVLARRVHRGVRGRL